MDVGDGTDELGEDALDLGGLECARLEEVVVKFVACDASDARVVSRAMRRTWAVLEHQPDQLLSHYDLVQARDVRMYELAVVVDLARQVGIVLLRRLEHDLDAISQFSARELYGCTLEPLLSLCEAR